MVSLFNYYYNYNFKFTFTLISICITWLGSFFVDFVGMF